MRRFVSLMLCGNFLFFVAGLIALTLMPAATANELLVPEQHKSIQAAIDHATAGDVILVSAGTYRERLTLKPGVALRSAGDDEARDIGLKRAATAVINLDGEALDGPGVVMAEGAVLDGFTVTGVGKYDDASWREHHATRGANQQHEHIGHFDSPAVGISGITCQVIHCIVHHNGSTGIAIRGIEGKQCEPIVRKNICYRNMGGGIGAMKGCGGQIVENRCYENFYAGIGHSGGHPTVVGNDCYENIRAGIGVSEGACPVVRQNKCYRNRRAGIGVRTGQATQPLIAENECYENGMAGIGCEEDARPVIRDNHCHHNEMAGIGAQDGAMPLIASNLCEENKLAGIGCRSGARPLIQGNTSRKNATAGIGVQDVDTFATIRHNRCEENKLVAIGLPDGASAVIESNYALRTGGVPPLVAIKGGSNATLINNEFHGGGMACILIEGRARLAGNNLQRSGDVGGNGIWVWKESQLFASDNLVDGYATGINAAGASVSATGNKFRHFKTAIRVTESTSPANVIGNQAEVENGKLDEIFSIKGTRGVVDENKLAAPVDESP